LILVVMVRDIGGDNIGGDGGSDSGGDSGSGGGEGGGCRTNGLSE
jgi:hypothetical protein